MEAYKIIEHRNGMKEIVPTKSDLDFMRESENDYRVEMKSLRVRYLEARKDLREKIMSEVLTHTLITLILAFVAFAILDIAQMPVIAGAVCVFIGIVLTWFWKDIYKSLSRYKLLDKDFVEGRNKLLAKYGLR